MSNSLTLVRKARIADIAYQAGVSTATVDRVLNGRPNVSIATRQRVVQAKTFIESGSQAARKLRPWRLKVYLPDEAGPSTDYLARCLQEVGTESGAIVECLSSKKMEPAILARKLNACSSGINGVAFQVLDDQRVRDAVKDLSNRNIPCLALMSDLENSRVIGSVGMNNRVAGRTASYLMGRLVRQYGPVAVVTGGFIYRVHEDREMGFRFLMRSEFPQLDVAETCYGGDDIDGNYHAVRNLLQKRPDIVGIYNVGGGNEGIVRAIKEAGIAREILFIGHNLTPKTQAYLLDGSMDIVLHQNMQQIAHQAVNTLVAYLEKRPLQIDVLPTEIVTRENIIGTNFG